MPSTEWPRLDALPTTNFRIVITVALIIVVVLAWVCVYVIGGKSGEPGGLEPMLFFLGALAGLDTTHFLIKRRTQLTTPPSVMASDAGAAAVAVVANEAPVPQVPNGAPFSPATSGALAPRGSLAKDD